jgi:hypothetical protein
LGKEKRNEIVENATGGSRFFERELRPRIGRDGINVITGQSADPAQSGRPDDVGVIGVAVFRKRQDLPAAAISKSEARAADQELGTGHGRREDSPARYVSFERATSAPAEVVTLYYDSYRNLLARGVIRQPVPVAPLPRPFPDFVPDPRG